MWSLRKEFGCTPVNQKLAILKSRVISEESETFGDVETEFNHEDESDDAIGHTDKPFISCAEEGVETDGDETDGDETDADD
ncbi:hypothetical protein JCM33374_g6084 [Metschnikowia sp. JCM 33374]|nr:hypothetical protein JCM33374_g6084 [Metschnikowia sp. JCM 33374]